MGLLSLFGQSRRPPQTIEPTSTVRAEADLLKLQGEAEKLVVETAKARHDDVRADALLGVEKRKLLLAVITVIASAIIALATVATFIGTSFYQSNQIQLLRDQNSEGSFAALVQQFSSGPSTNTRLAAATGLELYLEPRQDRYYSRALRLLALSMASEDAASVRTLVADILVHHVNADSLQILYAQNRTAQKELRELLQVRAEDFVCWKLPFKTSPTASQEQLIALLAWNTRVLADSLVTFSKTHKTIASDLSPIGVFWSLPKRDIIQTLTPPPSSQSWDIPGIGMIVPPVQDGVEKDRPYAEFVDVRFEHVHFDGSKLSNLVFRRCTFESCDFTNTALDETVFYDCTFQGGIIASFQYVSVVDYLVDTSHPPIWKNCGITLKTLWPRFAYKSGANPLPIKLQRTPCLQFIDNGPWKIAAVHPTARPHFDLPLEGSGTQVGVLK